MDRWNAEMGRVRDKKGKRKKIEKRESLRRKKIQVREKERESRNTVFFHWFVAPEGRKVGSLKRRVRSQLARWDGKIARRCGAKHMSKWKAKSTSRSEHFLKLRCRKSARRCGAKHMSKVEKAKNTSRSEHFLKLRCRKTPQLRSTFRSWDVAKVHAVVARSTFPSQKCKKTDGFGAIVHLVKSEQNVRVL